MNLLATGLNVVGIVILSIFLGFVFVYIIARLVTSAYFRSKREYLTNYFKEGFKEKS